MQVTMIGLDLAKNVFQVYGIDEHGEVAFNRALRRAQVLAFFERLEPYLVGIEACGNATIGHGKATKGETATGTLENYLSGFGLIYSKKG